jgi:hypothetical protein
VTGILRRPETHYLSKDFGWIYIGERRNNWGIQSHTGRTDLPENLRVGQVWMKKNCNEFFDRCVKFFYTVQGCKNFFERVKEKIYKGSTFFNDTLLTAKV